SRDNMLPTHVKLSSSLTCRLVGGLTREQRAVCHEAPDTVAIAFEGLQLAVKECQHQFRWHRWNCSSLMTKSSNPHSSSIMKRGFVDLVFSTIIAHVDVKIYEHGRWETTNNKLVVARWGSHPRPAISRYVWVPPAGPRSTATPASSL
ncbi:hypothetical protein SFRURICE_021222, partial [Spodoptera frugiperda]